MPHVNNFQQKTQVAFLGLIQFTLWFFKSKIASVKVFQISYNFARGVFVILPKSKICKAENSKKSIFYNHHNVDILKKTVYTFDLFYQEREVKLLSCKNNVLELRRSAVDFVAVMSEKTSVSKSSQHLAIALYDQFVNSTKVICSEVQLLLICCLTVACKCSII